MRLPNAEISETITGMVVYIDRDLGATSFISLTWPDGTPLQVDDFFDGVGASLMYKEARLVSSIPNLASFEPLFDKVYPYAFLHPTVFAIRRDTGNAVVIILICNRAWHTTGDLSS